MDSEYRFRGMAFGTNGSECVDSASTKHQWDTNVMLMMMSNVTVDKDTGDLYGNNLHDFDDLERLDALVVVVKKQWHNSLVK